MSNYGGFNFTGFGGVNLKNTAAIRFANNSGTSINTAGTIAIPNDDEGDRAWTFPAKSGTFPIMGTFTVSVPVIAAGAFSRTAVTISGIRTEDGVVVTVQGDPLKNAGATQNPAQLIAASAGNGSLTLTFASLGGTTTAYQEVPCAYVAVR